MRIRTIKPAFWANEKMSVMPHFTRLLAIGLLNYADDHGYFWANPLMVRGALFPFDDDSSNVRRALAQLAEEGYLRLGVTEDGREAGQVINFSKHQRVDRPADSDIKPLVIFDDRSTNARRSIDDRSSLDRKGREGNILQPKPEEAAKPRERNVLFDALCLFEGIPLDQVGAKTGARIATALKEIKAISPDVTAEEIHRRGNNYSTHFSTTKTAMALASHWGKCFSSNGVRSVIQAEVRRV